MRVRIKCSQTVRYDQTVEMTEQEWELLKKGDHQTDALYGWLDASNIHNSDEVEDDDMEAFVCDDSGKPSKPYNGIGG